MLRRNYYKTEYLLEDQNMDWEIYEKEVHVLI